MTTYEVPEPIINTPFEEPAAHWYIHGRIAVAWARRPCHVQETARQNQE